MEVYQGNRQAVSLHCSALESDHRLLSNPVPWCIRSVVDIGTDLTPNWYAVRGRKVLRSISGRCICYWLRMSHWSARNDIGSHTPLAYTTHRPHTMSANLRVIPRLGMIDHRSNSRACSDGPKIRRASQPAEYRM